MDLYKFKLHRVGFSLKNDNWTRFCMNNRKKMKKYKQLVKGQIRMFLKKDLKKEIDNI